MASSVLFFLHKIVTFVLLWSTVPAVHGLFASDKEWSWQNKEEEEESQHHVRATRRRRRKIPSKPIGVDAQGRPVRMPLVGAGTWQYNETVAYASLCKAFQVGGYTMVDTAFGYGNQRGVGRAIRDCYQGMRDDLFVLTKVPGGLTYHQVMAAHKQNLMELQLEYVDHVMTHFPADWQVEHASRQQRQEEWQALESIYRSGEARSIGISHYCPQHIDDVLQVANVLPSLNQVEYHVGSGDVDHVVAKCREHGITFMSFSPLCGPCQYESQDSLVDGTLVTAIAERYNVTGSQVSLRFIVQQALDQPYMGGVIPKSNNEAHIRSNSDVFSFRLSEEDMERLRRATKPAGEAGDCDVP